MLLDAVYSSVHHVIAEEQHGFVRKRSTTTNLMCYVSTIIEKLEKRQQVDAIYIDFSKAFDKVPHRLLVEKLKRTGLPDWLTEWIWSYLTGRSAFVRVGNTQSAPFDICSGVPQGSHLGPLLFVLFINDLCKLLKSPKSMYADDLKVFRVITSPLDCCVLQSDIDVVTEWCEINGMELNTRKCNSITFSRSRCAIVFDYKIVSSSVSRVTVIKDLGIYLDTKLKFSEQVAAAIAKAFSMLGLIRRNTQSFENVYCLKTLYCSIVRSILEYAVPVWSPYHDVQINRIESVQKCFIRYALRLLPWSDPVHLPPYEDRCRLIHLPTLMNRRKTLQRLLIFDIVSNNIDCADLLGKIPFNAPRRLTRRVEFLRLPTHRTLFGQNNPLDVCCRLFNQVTNCFDFCVSKSVFRLRISP